MEKYSKICLDLVNILSENFNNDYFEKIRINKNNFVKEKGFGDYVTAVDKDIEQKLVDTLAEKYPEFGVISEEGTSKKSETGYWIIDPIDGTTNFLHGLPFAISVALKVKNKTKIGVVYIPMERKCYYAVDGKKAYCLDNGLQRVVKTNAEKITKPLIIFGIPYDKNLTESLFDKVNKLSKISCDLKRIGPASYDICRVADNIADAYIEYNLKEWDVSAGILILKEAGGKYEKKDNLFCFVKKNMKKQIEEIVC